MADDLDVDNWEHLRFAKTDELPVLDDDLIAALEAEIAAEAATEAETETETENEDQLDEPEPAEDAPAEDEPAEEEPTEEPSGEHLATVTELAPKSTPADDEDEATDTEAAADEPAEAGAEGSDGSGVVVHTRMRNRRIAVRREEGQRRLRRLTWALGGLALLVDGAALVQTPLVDVERIEVAGATRSGAETVAWASGIDPGDAVLTVDEQAAEQRIESLAWVRSADVQKKGASTIQVTVVERTPAAVLASTADAPRAIVDETGRVLQIGGEMPPGLVTVTGVPPVMSEGEQLPKEARDALLLAVAAPKQVPGAITAVSLRLEAALTRGGVVRFGSLEDLDEKLVDLATVLARVDLRSLCVIDVKVPGSATVSRQPC